MAVHLWPGAQTARCSGRWRICVVEESALAAEVLLQSSQISFVAEKQGSHSVGDLHVLLCQISSVAPGLVVDVVGA